MIKRIIFDLDNTLIKWKEEYNISIIKAYRKFNIELSIEQYNEFDRTLRRYEKEVKTFNKEVMMEFFNKNFSIGMPEGYIDEWLRQLYNCVPEESNDVKEVVEYLSKKYELVVLTNWYVDSQVGRLKNIGIIDYFNEVIGADITELKPSEKAFIYAKGKHNFDECVMIGDSIEIDLEVPKKLGMQTILLTDKDTYYDKRIKNIRELEEML